MNRIEEPKILAKTFQMEESAEAKGAKKDFLAALFFLLATR